LTARNEILGKCLPDGSVCLASTQFGGRGRGKNSWISQNGCLMFSLRKRHKRVSSVVFIQYLFGLAVVQAFKNQPTMKVLIFDVEYSTALEVAQRYLCENR
jgi:biotin--protein ligase